MENLTIPPICEAGRSCHYHHREPLDNVEHILTTKFQNHPKDNTINNADGDLWRSITKEISELRVHQHTIDHYALSRCMGILFTTRSRTAYCRSDPSQPFSIGRLIRTFMTFSERFAFDNACKLTVEVDRKPSPETMDLLE